MIDGVVAGAKAIWNLISDAKGKKERWEKFVEARKGWEEMSENARKLEKLLDNFLKSQELMGKIQESIDPKEKYKLSREHLVSHLSISTRRLKKRKSQLQKIFDETNDMQCEEVVAVKMDKVDKLMASGVGLKKILEQQQFAVYNDKMFCNELQKIMGKLGEAEAALQTFRINILNARSEWEDHNEGRIEQMADAIERINDEDTAEDFMEKRVDNAEKLYDAVKDGIKHQRNNWLDNCKTSHLDWKKSGSRIGRHSNSFQKSRVRRKIKKECEHKYSVEFDGRSRQRLADAKASMQKKITAAKRDFERSRNSPLEIDTSVEDQRLLAYYKWFSDIEQQQYCYTHREEEKCKRAGRVKFMGPFYVLDRAKVKLQNICRHDQYVY